MIRGLTIAGCQDMHDRAPHDALQGPISQNTGYTLPSAPKAEKGLLGNLICDLYAAMPIASEAGVTPDSFESIPNRILADELWATYHEGKQTNLLLIGQKLDGKGLLNDVGGELHLSDCVDASLSMAYTEGYAEEVFEASRRRNLMLACHKASCHLSTGGDWAEVAGGLASVIENAGATSKSIDAAIAENIEMARGVIESGQPAGIPSPWPDFDKRGGRIGKGQVTMLCAQGGTGKSVAALNWAVCAAHIHGIPTSVYPLEDGVNTWLQRAAGLLEGHSYLDVMEGAVPIERIQSGHDALRNMPLWLDDGDMDVRGLCSKISAGVLRHKWEFVVIDAFKDIRRRGKIGEHLKEEEDMLIALAHLAKRHGIAILLLHHTTKTDTPWRWLTDMDARGSLNLQATVRRMIILQRVLNNRNDDPQLEENYRYYLDNAKINFGTRSATEVTPQFPYERITETAMVENGRTNWLAGPVAQDFDPDGEI